MFIETMLIRILLRSDERNSTEFTIDNHFAPPNGVVKVELLAINISPLTR